MRTAATPARRLALALATLGAIFAAAAIVALFVGSARLSPGVVVAALLGRESADSVATVVTLGLRLPRIAVAALAGGGLAVAGVGFQALTRNPLAEPSVLGVSAGAAFGVVLAQIFGLGFTILAAVGLAAFAFAGAMLAATAVWVIAAAGPGMSIPTLLLAGVIVGIFFSSAITVLISIVDFNRLGGVIHWLLGNLAPIPAGALGVFATLAALGFWLIVGQARELNVLALGEESAAQLGVDAERLKRRIFGGAALLTAASVAFAGPIGFVGLIVPHLLRGIIGPDHRLLVPASLFGGGALLVVCDTIARMAAWPDLLSAGAVTAVLGGPFFVLILVGQKRRAALWGRA